MMGKAADNEAIKLRATYYNNLSVGMAIGGVLVPYLAFFQRISEIEPALIAIRNGGTDNADVRKLIGFFIAIAAALLISKRWRARARREIAKLQD
jgi:hypothetical protein